MLFRKGDFMPENEFTHLFPEWVLTWSLHQTCKDTSGFWDFRIVHPGNEPDILTKFSTLFPSLAKAPMLYFEIPFEKEEAKIYGIPETNYEKTFWGLRPDFVIKDGEGSLILLLESKSGDKPEKIYTSPRERSYYEFLRQCNKTTRRGFYYVIPRAHLGFCRICLAEYFPEEPNLHSGFVLWEDLLSIIGDEIIRTVSDQVLKEMEGIKKLQEWEKKLAG
jgi:ribosomal protein S14